MGSQPTQSKPTRRHGLAAAREAAGLTQEDLAARLGVERTTVFRWESGESTPRPLHRPGLAQLLSLNHHQLAALLAGASYEAMHPAPAAKQPLSNDQSRAETAPSSAGRPEVRTAYLSDVRDRREPRVPRIDSWADAEHGVQSLGYTTENNEATDSIPAAQPMSSVSLRGSARTDWEGQVIAMCADRARDFLARAEASNVGHETIDQLIDDVRRLVTAYQQQPLERILNEMADTQDRAFTLLEGRQRPDQTRDLYFLAGVTSGLMAKASHDVAASHDAMTQARTAYACADNAGHNGLRAWTRGLQALITYWSGRFADSVHYAELGAEVAERSRGTAAVWLASGKARALAAQGKMDEAQVAIEQATVARDAVQPDELDELGGLCTFSRPRQLYYAADALAWGAGKDEANRAERAATEAIDAYAAAPTPDRAFGDESGAMCDLAIARIHRRNIEGAAEALTPVLALPTAQRIHGIVTSVDYVRRVLHGAKESSPVVIALHDAIETFTVERLALPS